MTDRTPSIQNRKAYHDFHVLEGMEVGVALVGCEVKSIRAGKANLQDAFARIEKGEVFMYHMHISPYEHGNIHNPDPLRVRKLLLNRREIEKLSIKVKEKGLTLIPVKAYFKDGRVKIQLSLAKGKTHGDKRASLREKEAGRDIDRALRARQKRL